MQSHRGHLPPAPLACRERRKPSAGDDQNLAGGNVENALDTLISVRSPSPADLFVDGQQFGFENNKQPLDSGRPRKKNHQFPSPAEPFAYTQVAQQVRRRLCSTWPFRLMIGHHDGPSSHGERHPRVTSSNMLLMGQAHATRSAMRAACDGRCSHGRYLMQVTYQGADCRVFLIVPSQDRHFADESGAS